MIPQNRSPDNLIFCIVLSYGSADLDQISILMKAQQISSLPEEGAS